MFLTALFTAAPLSAQTKGSGYNNYGQLGIGNQTTQTSPVTITAVPEATGISTGYYHTLFLKSNGTVAASGYNDSGQIGDGTIGTLRTAPVAVSGLTNVIQVSGGGFFSTALKADGTVWAWGQNWSGQVGNGTTNTTGCQCISTPTQSSISNIVQISTGDSHALALKADGTVWAWGYNGYGNLGDGTTTQRPTPVQVGVGVTGFNNIIAVSAGEVHSMALKADGTVWVWGYNGYGQVGNGTQTPNNQLLPVKNTTLSNITQIAAGANHNMALKTDGTVWVWGQNSRGQVGNGSTTPGSQLTPVQTANSNIVNIIEIKGDGLSCFARRRDGTIWGWGHNDYGQLGNGSTAASQTTPVQAAIGAGNTGMSGGYYHAFSLKPAATAATGTNQTIYGEYVNLTFSNITGAGSVSYNAIDPSAVGGNYTVPPSYTIQNNQPAYDVTTTAAYSGTVDVCIKNIDEYDQTNFAKLKILHAEGSAWIDRTISSNFQSRQICARVSSLSPFVIAQYLAPTAGAVSVSGKILNSDGRGIRNVLVTLTDTYGNSRTVLSGFFGTYRFADVRAGETYILSVEAKRFKFTQPSVVLSVNEELTEVNFLAVDLPVWKISTKYDF